MPIPFTVDFEAASAGGNITAVTQAMLYDAPTQPSAIKFTWLPIPTSPENIDRIELWVTNAYETTKILSWLDPAVTEYIYPFPRSRVSSQYFIVQWYRSGANTYSQLWATVTTTITMDYISLVSVVDPATRRCVMQSWTEYGYEKLQNQEWQIPAGGKNYKELSGSLRGKDITFTANIEDRQDGSLVTAATTLAALDTLFDTTDTMCLRHPRGEKTFGRLNGNMRVQYKQNGVGFTVPIGLRRTSYAEA